jgi:hypothetical protein
VDGEVVVDHLLVDAAIQEGPCRSVLVVLFEHDE